ncbi:ATP-binding protein [Streptomyces rubrogriseus]|uniref:ATP-binding protein n=1 Tax=Streptomyces rubrogriseus TaxID=194673 RepID=A0A6G3TUC6_9ACTN|nr:ATP-binding protein [Streptomyces rubrogriseus]NEC39591.1 ATP-binding protein [Streptomyces rubrogriseus]
MDDSRWRPTQPWKLPFLAEADQVWSLRRALRIHLEYWGLHELTDAAELCASELVANVIKHVGPETPSTLVASLGDARLRIEVHDPDARALPTLARASLDAEAGRGMVLVDAMSDRWGVELAGDHKVTWCEFCIDLARTERRHMPMPRLARAADVLSLYSVSGATQQPLERGRLSAVLAEEAAINAISDLLHWFRAQGRDADDALDRAQSRFEAECEARLS